MSLVLALLGALRASLRTRTDLALENLALRRCGNNSSCFADARSNRNSGASTVSSGYGSPTSGLGGARRSMSFAPRP